MKLQSLFVQKQRKGKREHQIERKEGNDNERKEVRENKEEP